MTYEGRKINVASKQMIKRTLELWKYTIYLLRLVSTYVNKSKLTRATLKCKNSEQKIDNI